MVIKGVSRTVAKHYTTRYNSGATCRQVATRQHPHECYRQVMIYLCGGSCAFFKATVRDKVFTDVNLQNVKDWIFEETFKNNVC